MMQHRIRAAFGIAAVLLLASAPALADIKIAVVRSEVVQGSAAFKAAAARFQGEVDRRRTLIETESKQLADDLAKYQRDAATMSPDQRDKAEKDLNTRNAQLDFDKRKAQEELQNKDQELQGELMSKVHDVIVQVGKEKGYDLVVTNAVVLNSALDITDEVIKRLNQQNPPAAGAGK